MLPNKFSKYWFWGTLAICYIFIFFLFFNRPLTSFMVRINQSKVSQEKMGKFIEGDPKNISIPAVEISLEVLPGEYNLKTWTLFPDKALFALPSTKPNTKEGNTVIYGHNTNLVFYKTKNLVKDDYLYLTTQNGHTFTYKFVDFVLVNPNDTSVFDYKGEPRLTLITCDGFLNTKRKLMYFKLIETI